MAYDGWLEFGGTELVNLSRTAQLAEVLGIDTVWVDPASVQWIEDALGGTGYDDITTAPWYDPGHVASGEFAGIVPLSISGLDDSTLEVTTIEYVTSGGSSGKPRNKTLSIPANVAVVASTDRGADYGKRWLDRVLRGHGAKTFCAGETLRYFQHRSDANGTTPPIAHRRDVAVSRGTNVTRKRTSACSASWLVTFTLVANDPFEYGEEIEQFDDLGGAVAGPGVADSGQVDLTETGQPVYDYSPIYDPLHPALVPAPAAPDFYPDGWVVEPGMGFRRFWARLNPVEPTGLGVVPVLTLHTDAEARYVRASIFHGDADPSDQSVDPLWTAIVSYLPVGYDFFIDGEQEASYAWDGASPQVRRTDSVVYGTGARPVEWASFNDPDGLLVTLDLVTSEVGYDGGETVRASLSLVPKSD